jgi:hypothetical protein
VYEAPGSPQKWKVLKSGEPARHRIAALDGLYEALCGEVAGRLAEGVRGGGVEKY